METKKKTKGKEKSYIGYGLLGNNEWRCISRGHWTEDYIRKFAEGDDGKGYLKVACILYEDYSKLYGSLLKFVMLSSEMKKIKPIKIWEKGKLYQQAN